MRVALLSILSIVSSDPMRQCPSSVAPTSYTCGADMNASARRDKRIVAVDVVLMLMLMLVLVLVLCALARPAGYVHSAC